MKEQQQPYTIQSHYFWKITFCLALASFFIFASMYAVQPLLTVFVDEFAVNASTASLSMSFTIAGLIIGLIILGFLSDRSGRTIFIKLSLLGSVIPFFIMPLFPSFSLLLVFRLIQGFAMAGLPAAALAYLSEEIESRSVGVATALYISSNALGGMVGRVVAGYITDRFSWEAAFYVLAFLGLVVFLAILLLLPKSRFFTPSNLPFQQDIAGFLYHLKNPSMLLVFGLGIILQFSFTGVWTYLPFHLQEAPYHLSLQTISNMYLAYGLGVVGSPIAGWLAGRFSLKKLRLIGIVVLAIGIFMTVSTPLMMIVIGLCVACLGFFTAHSLTATSVSEAATHHKGSASSLYLVAYYIGVSFGSTAAAPIWEKGGWIGLVLFAGVLPVVYIIFIQFVQKRNRQVVDE
ncbi:MFS transporter [Lentibacillus sp. N15]|uniref:MFS transporter n=1 Tax=Lentibacillus songyuanensis TaxID=3136161 RepID=UPI0031BB9619